MLILDDASTENIKFSDYVLLSLIGPAYRRKGKETYYLH